MSLLNLTLT